MRPARTETFEHTISGLLKKRSELFNEAEGIRDRLAEIKNDIDALDRVLGTLGYTGDLDAAMPRQKRHVVFGKGELTTNLLRELRIAERPLTSRELAQGIVSLGGDARDRKFVADVVKRVSKALRSQREAGIVHSEKDERGNVLWSLKHSKQHIKVEEK